MVQIMTKEQEIYNNVTDGSCHQCDYGRFAEPAEQGGEVVMTIDCTIEDINNCPVVIHDMSL